MKTLRISALLLSAVLVGCGKKKDDGDPSATYTIKLPNKKAGEKYEITMTEESDDINFAEPTSTAKKNTGKFIFMETIESMGSDRVVTKAKHTYTKAENTQDGKTTSLKIANKTVLIEQKPDKSYSFKYEGGTELTGVEASKLANAFQVDEGNKMDLMLPDKPVKEGETWTPDTKKIAEMMDKGMEPRIDANKITATGKLVKAYKKDGAQFGVIELNMKAPLSEGDTVDLSTTIDTCIDGSVMELKLDLSARIMMELKGKNTEINTKRTMVLKTVK